MKAVFIGTGNMGGALVRAACRSVGAEQVTAYNRTPAKAEALAKETGCAVAYDLLSAAGEGTYLFLGVKPHLIRDVIAQLRPVLEGKVLVSMAAGVTTADLSAAAEGNCPVLRIMPNTPCSIGKGMVALCAGPGGEEAHLAAVEEILSGAGLVRRIEESHMDAFSAVAGCGPAFAYQFIEALADGGVLAGLPRGEAQTYAAQMLLGSAAMVLETGDHPGALKDAVCSPGGSTIAGVAALERGGFRAAAINAVETAWQKNAKLGK